MGDSLRREKTACPKAPYDCSPARADSSYLVTGNIWRIPVWTQIFAVDTTDTCSRLAIFSQGKADQVLASRVLCQLVFFGGDGRAWGSTDRDVRRNSLW